MARSPKGRDSRDAAVGCIELTAGQLQVIARVQPEELFRLHIAYRPESPVRTEEGALALLQLVPPQVAYRGDTEAGGYSLAGCVSLTRKLIAACRPESTIRCLVVDRAAPSVDPAMLGTLMYKACTIDELVKWATQTEIWEWWHWKKPTAVSVAEFFDLGRNRAADLLRSAKGEPADTDAENANADNAKADADNVKVDANNVKAEADEVKVDADDPGAAGDKA
ncbi:hypothetical protein [Solimonas sp. SE-A11]|uniref:hypothetical protein n=1 Tax=Solimonas sp. SE-A11 TaxID=3054954 RepID=UPI00259D0AC0|nr:hypothetical protein [Solimonas sp. SE-A11]MDM4772605.1 hypothetical protein [Solimonas sp. SE-A11]